MDYSVATNKKVYGPMLNSLNISKGMGLKTARIYGSVLVW